MEGVVKDMNKEMGKEEDILQRVCDLIIDQQTINTVRAVQSTYKLALDSLGDVIKGSLVMAIVDAPDEPECSRLIMGSDFHDEDLLEFLIKVLIPKIESDIQAEKDLCAVSASNDGAA